MKDKKTGLIQTLIGAIILVIGIVLCVNTYIVKGSVGIFARTILQF